MPRPRPTLRRVAATALAAAWAATIGACVHAPLPETEHLAWREPPAAGDSTLALWRLDESTGFDFADAGPGHCDGVYGIDTRAAFGRFRTARQFSASINSFALVPAARAPQLGSTWTIEAWIHPTSYGPVECSVIACRWTDQPDEQGWMFGLTGFDHVAVTDQEPLPALFSPAIPHHSVGQLAFIFQPQNAGAPLGMLSTAAVELDRWTHVAVTDDGSELRMYLDGRLDAQYATTARVRETAAALVIGNQLDARWLTESQGSPRVPSDATHYPFYAFEGIIDELRISAVALGAGTLHK